MRWSVDIIRIAVAIASGVAVLTGCYSYVPADLGTVPEGGDVQLHLTREGVASLEALPLERQARTVEGTLLRTDPDGLLLRIPVGTRREGFHTSRLDQQVRISTEHLALVERKELDRLKTGLVVAGGSIAAGTVLFLILEGSELYSDNPRPESPEARIPLFSFSVP